MWRVVSDPRFVWGLWVVYAAAAAAVRLSHPPDMGVVYYCYLSGGMNFLAGADLYDGTGNNFVYLPTAALPFLPLTFLPYVVSGALWRIRSAPGMNSAGGSASERPKPRMSPMILVASEGIYVE